SLTSAGLARSARICAGVTPRTEHIMLMSSLQRDGVTSQDHSGSNSAQSRSRRSAHKDHKAVALVGHRTHIVAQPGKLVTDLGAQILPVTGAWPRRHIVRGEQTFHILSLENAAELARLLLAMQASGATASHAFAAQEQIAKRVHGAHISDRHKV